MKTVSRIFAILLGAALLVASLAACGGTTDGESSFTDRPEDAASSILNQELRFAADVADLSHGEADVTMVTMTRLSDNASFISEDPDYAARWVEFLGAIHVKEITAPASDAREGFALELSLDGTPLFIGRGFIGGNIYRSENAQDSILHIENLAEVQASLDELLAEIEYPAE